MAKRQGERALAWKEISPTDLGLGMGLTNRIAHLSRYRGALVEQPQQWFAMQRCFSPAS